MAFPAEKLGPKGFRVPMGARNVPLPDGTLVEDGSLFHRNFLSDPANRRFIREADIRAFIPCGGVKDTVNRGNVRNFLSLFEELQFIVEGANVFFDDAARRYIATNTAIRHIKDTTANKGGVFSSAVSEVLTAFLFGDDYEANLLEDAATRWGLIGDILTLVDTYARAETDMLIRIHDADPSVPLFELSGITSERIFALQAAFEERIEEILADDDLVWQTLTHYIPAILVQRLGRERITAVLNAPALAAYRNAILTKKLASMAFYRYGMEWDAFLERAAADVLKAARSVVTPG